MSKTKRIGIVLTIALMLFTPVAFADILIDEEQDVCEQIEGLEGWFARYYNLPISHPDMELPEELAPDDGHGDPLSEEWDTDWYDEQWYRFSQVDEDLLKGGMWFPFDAFPEELTEIFGGAEEHEFHFSAHFQAWVIPPEPGVYDYEFQSDDDSWIYLDGELAVDNGGLHFVTPKPGSLQLDGPTKMEVFFAERHTFESGLDFEFLDGDIQILPHLDECEETCEGDCGATTISVGSTAMIIPGNSEPPTVEYLWVLPDESDDPETQVDIIPSGERNDIYACIVVSDVDSRDTIEDVFVDLYHPDESFKYQVHADWLNPVTQSEEIEECKTLARDRSLISSQDWEDINYNIFSQPNWYMYKVYLPMYYHQPSGDYDVRAYAVDSTSELSEPLTRFFTWVPGTFLELDFTEVMFGSIQPGAWKILNGDLDMGTPDAPTLKNEGNTEVQVGVEFTKFVGSGELPNKEITRFDAQLRNMGTNNYGGIPGEHLEFNADERVEFTYPIGLCRQEKIDFSIHADVGTVPDEYTGSVTIYATPVLVDSPPEGVEFPVDEEELREVLSLSEGDGQPVGSATVN